MIELKLYKSYELAEEIADTYNAGKKLGQQLRKGHVEGLKALIRIMKKEMAKYQLVGADALKGRALRALKTNRKQLSKWLRCCEKTAYNYLMRMETAGVLRKTFRGSNASFDIDLNTDLLWLQDGHRNDAANVAVLLENPLPHMRQSLPHTLSPSVTCQVTNEYNELGMAAPAVAPTSSGAAPSVANPKRPDTSPDTEPGYHPGSENRATYKPVTTPPKSSAKKVPPARAPLTVEDAADLLPGNLHGKFRARLDQVWNYAQEHFAEWYPGYIVPAEAERGRAALAEFFVYSKPSSWNAATKEFLKRIDMVDGHLTKRKDNGLTAWLPIPSRYFDHRYAKGFAGTKAWYKTYNHQVKLAIEDKAVSRCLTLHYAAVQSGDADKLADTTTRIKQYLEKKGGAKLYARFTGKIFTQATINAPAAQA